MRFVVSLDGVIAVSDSQGKQPANVGELLETYLDAVMEEFYNVHAQDPNIELDLVSCHVKFEVLVGATDPDAALNEASPLIRSAIHGAGGATPDWPPSDNKTWSVRQAIVSVRTIELVGA